MNARMWDPNEALEFIHATMAADVLDCRRLADTTGTSSLGLEASSDRGDDEGASGRHLFLLRHHGQAVAALWAHELSPRSLSTADGSASDQLPATCALDRLAARERQGGGCSYRLLLTLWCAQWLVAHRSIRKLTASCRTDELHRWGPVGFETVSRWFHTGGASGHGVVRIAADAHQVAQTGRDIGLEQVLDAALAAGQGRSVLSEEMASAA
jgi:hypothetical protein